MKTTSFLVLAVVTFVVAVAAVATVWQRERSTLGAYERQALYPGLGDRINDVDKIAIETKSDGAITISRKDGKWGLDERSGYPVDFEKVRRALIDVSDIETIEPRTADPDKYKKLQVEDPDGETASSIRFRAWEGDTELADLVIGRTRAVDLGGGVFVRRYDEPRSWLATGDFQPPRRLILWLDRNIVNVDQRRIRSAEITRPDGGTVRIEKTDPAAEDYTLVGPVPEGRQAKPAHDLRALASALDFLIFEDVRPHGEVDFAAAEAVVGRFETYDGLQVTVRAVEQDGKTWTDVALAEGTRSEDLDAFVAEHKGKDSREGRIADLMQPPEAIAETIAEKNAFIGRWAYELTGYKTGVIRSSIESLTEAKKAEEQPSAEKPAEGGEGGAAQPPSQPQQQ